MLILLRSWSLVLVIMSSISVLICNHFYVIEANSEEITTFYTNTPL